MIRLLALAFAVLLIASPVFSAIDIEGADLLVSEDGTVFIPEDRVEKISDYLIMAIDYKREIIIDEFIDNVGKMITDGKMAQSDVSAVLKISNTVIEKIMNTEDGDKEFLAAQEKKFKKLISKLERYSEKMSSVPQSRSASRDVGNVLDGIFGEVENYWAKDCGKKLHKALTSQYQVINDPNMTERVRAIGRRVVDASRIDDERSKYTFTVLDMRDDNNEEMLNAFAGPAGYVYVTPKLLYFLGNDDNILAGVLGHEIAHNTQKHVVDAMKRSLIFKLILGSEDNQAGWIKITRALLLDLPLSREHEFDADEKGIEYANRAGFNPYGIINFFEKLSREYDNYKPSEFEVIFQTHPPTGERIARAVSYIQNHIYNQPYNNPYNNNPYNNGYPSNQYPNNPYPNNPNYPNNGYPNNGYPNPNNNNNNYYGNGTTNNGYPNNNTGYNNGYPTNNGYPNNNTGYNNGYPNNNTGYPNTSYPNTGYPSNNSGTNPVYNNNGGVPAPPNTNGAPGTQFNPPFQGGPNPGRTQSVPNLELMKDSN